MLSSVDAATDIYVVGTYYSEGLHGQANAMLGMISANLFIQLLTVLAVYQKKRWTVKLKEVIITLLFLRPVVDAYRISTNYDDGESTVDPLVEMILNKVRSCTIHYLRIKILHLLTFEPSVCPFVQGVELATESIPGCVLQIYVLLTKTGVAGAGPIVSIGISALTTGFASAMIAFDKDVDAKGRKHQPTFYGELFSVYFCCINCCHS